MSELKHAAQNPEPLDYDMMGCDLVYVALNLIGEDIEDRERYVNACANAAILCFEVDSLKTSMMELYKRLEGMK